MPNTSITAFILNYASRLSYPRLTALVLVVLALDLILPDLIPFFDELLLGIIAILLATRKKKPPKVVDDKGDIIEHKALDRDHK